MGKEVSQRRREKRAGGGVTFDDAAVGGSGQRTVRQGSSSSRLRGSKSGRNSEALHAACDRKRRSSHCYGFDADLTAPTKERPGRSVCRESSQKALAREEQRKSEKQLADAAAGAMPTDAFMAGAVSRDEGGGVVEGGARESSWATETNPLAV